MRIATLVTIVTVALAPAETDFEPARLETSRLAVETVQPPFAGGGQVLLELTIGPSGDVADVSVLRSTPPFTQPLESTVRSWRFASARARDQETDALVSVESRVLVAGVFRPAATYDAPARGEAPEDVAAASEQAPFPLSIATPLYPPHAGSHTGHFVLVEVEVGDEGDVGSTRIVRSSPGFDGVALDASRLWRFRPAKHEGRPVSSYVYIVFGFREPVAS